MNGTQLLSDLFANVPDPDDVIVKGGGRIDGAHPRAEELTAIKESIEENIGNVAVEITADDVKAEVEIADIEAECATKDDAIRSALNVPSYDFADPAVQREADRLIEERGLMTLVMTAAGTCHIVQGYISPTRIGEFRRLSDCQTTGLLPNQLKADCHAARCYVTTSAGPKSYKSELYAERTWSSNSCRYATEKEAEAAGAELMSRWMVPTDRRVAPSDDPVNARFNFDTYKSELLDHAPSAPPA